MATSGSINYNRVTNQIIEEAFDLCGIGSEGEAISPDQYERAKRSLNLLVKTWNTSDHLWLRTEASVTLVASQANYALATLFSEKPLRVLEVRRRDSDNIDVQLNEYARDTYMGQSNKTSTGVPVAYYYDPQLTTGTLYVWPTPGTTEASEYTLRVTYLRIIEDFDGSADDADLPQEWLMALCYGLANELALKYGVAPDIRGEIKNRAIELKAKLESWDTEPASIFLQPEPDRC